MLQITASDCEGAGEMFRVTTLPSELSKIPKTKEGHIDFSQDFFGKAAYLTVSGQLSGETYACALGDIYTFGPTFRAENSQTSRHLAEFWMIEPEMAFADLTVSLPCLCCSPLSMRFIASFPASPGGAGPCAWPT